MPWNKTDAMTERTKFVLEWYRRWDEGEGRRPKDRLQVRPPQGLTLTGKMAGSSLSETGDLGYMHRARPETWVTRRHAMAGDVFGCPENAGVQPRSDPHEVGWRSPCRAVESALLRGCAGSQARQLSPRRTR